MPEQTMRKQKMMKLSGCLWLLAAGMFMLAGALGEQVAFYGVGAAFIGIGVAFLAQSRKSPPEQPPEA